VYTSTISDLRRFAHSALASARLYSHPGFLASFVTLFGSVFCWWIIEHDTYLEHRYELDKVVLVLGIAVATLLFVASSLWVTLKKELVELKRANHSLLRHEALLQDSQRRSQHLFETNPHPMWFYDLETLQFLDVNEAAIQQYGYSRKEFLQKSVLDIRPDDEKERFLSQLRDCPALGDRSGLWRHLRKDGTTLLVSISAYRHVIDGREVELVLANDVTAKIEAEEALKRSEASFRSFVDNAPYGIFRSDIEMDCFLEVNPTLVRLFGYDHPDELRQLKISETIYNTPSDRRKLIDELRLHGTVQFMEFTFLKKHGSTMQVRLSATLCCDEHGYPSLIEGFVEDITETHQLEEKLRQSQKMDAIGRLAGGIAHDFNNMLTAVIGYTDMLSASAGLTERQRKHVQQASNAAHRAASLTKQLLAFSRQQVLQPTLIDSNSVIQETLEMIRRLLDDHIIVNFDRQGEPAMVFADPSQLAQILMNLCLNARDAMPHGGTLSIATSTVLPDDHILTLHPGMQRISYVCIAVSDSGEGMAPEIQARVFEPFFTTKGLGKGTGLGLATVHGLVAQSKGFISVESQIGVGTCFRVYLPACFEERNTLPLSSETSLASGTAWPGTVRVISE
jgi:two-component system cell cycle sensor histidine kinase/response regulator CckA